MSQMPPPVPPRPHRTPHKATPGVAVAALILGIVAIVLSPLLIFGLLAVGLGLVGISKTGEPSGRPGRGFAIAGLALGGVSLVFGLLLAVAILLPAIGAGRRTAQRMQNSTQMRYMHQGMVTFANSNKEFFPGLDAKGNILRDGADTTGNSGHGDTAEARFWILLDGNFLTPDYAISPSETDPRTEWSGAGPVTADHYSYALLSIAGQPEQGPRAIRATEWNQSLNTQAIVASDRNTGTNATTSVQSVHTSRPGEWKGAALWNDNHVGFEMTQFFETRYGNGELNVDPAGMPNDNLFADDGGADALMVD